MGLGKTVQVLTYLPSLKSNPRLSFMALLLVPKFNCQLAKGIRKVHARPALS
ncbi:MAG: hypothetical protein IPL17_20045 [Anaerolineales bacterium]|nr:hypothetical protein [Anaerolineales bacterium]